MLHRHPVITIGGTIILILTATQLVVISILHAIEHASSNLLFMSILLTAASWMAGVTITTITTTVAELKETVIDMQQEMINNRARAQRPNATIRRLDR